MVVSPQAGRPAYASQLVNVEQLIHAYYELRPEAAVPSQRVAFGTSGHRGSAFNAAHIVAITAVICRYRAQQGYDGRLFVGKDTHALSEPALRTALEVLAAHEIDVRIDSSSPHAMAGLIRLKDRFDLALGNDADVDRHGIVTRGADLLNPNHFLSAAISYLYQQTYKVYAESFLGADHLERILDEAQHLVSSALAMIDEASSRRRRAGAGAQGG